MNPIETLVVRDLAATLLERVLRIHHGAAGGIQMGLAHVSIRYEWTVFSSFSGQRAENDDGPNAGDRTLLFVYYGEASEYGLVSRACVAPAREVGIDDARSIDPRKLAGKLTVDGGLLLEVDTGWNGVNFYGFASAEDE